MTRQAGGPGKTRHRRTAAVVMTVLAGIALAASATAGAAGRTTSVTARMAGASPRAREALTSLTLTSVDPDGEPAAGPSTQAVIAADGRYAAFVSLAGAGNQASAVYLRDQVSGTTEQVSDPSDGSASAPGISADGRLVSYEQDGEVFTAVQRADGLAVRQVTGSSGDTPYAHVLHCPAALGTGRVTPCGPRLSGNGTTLVYPAELTPVSPELSVSAIVGNAEGGYSQVPLRGDMLDLTPYSPSAIYENPDGRTATVSYTDKAASPVGFTDVAITEPRGFPAGQPFQLGQTTCAGTLTSGNSCTALVSFGGSTCADVNGGLITGSLVTGSSVPAGQSVIELTAMCPFGDASAAARTGGPVTMAYHAGPYRGPGAATGPPGCPAPPTGLPLTAAPAITASAVSGAPFSDAGAAEAGRPYVMWLPVSARSVLDDAEARVFFAAANGHDCGIQLVDPAALKLADPLPASAPAPCFQDEPLSTAVALSHRATAASLSPPPHAPVTRPSVARPSAAAAPSSCTAYLLINPAPVTADAAFLGWTFMSEGGKSGPIPTAYITVQGVQHVILTRHDSSTTGNFAASPATVVSVTGDGAELPDATEPSVSADGRYVGFAAPVPDGTAGQQPIAGASEVWLHDTGWLAADPGPPGSTTLVSCLPGPDVGRCLAAPDADSPSLSGSGQQVAFATAAAVVPDNGYEAAPGGPGGAAGAAPPSPDQVYVRSAGAQTTALVSAQASGKNAGLGGGAPSYAPAITQDATSVAFVSQAAGLTAAPLAAGAANLYLAAAPYLGAGTEIASASGAGFPAGTAVGMPSVDAIGRLAVFPASAALLPAAPAGGTSAYTFGRFPRLSPSPADTAFGRILLDSGTRHGRVTVTNTGPGPGTVTGVTMTGPFQVTGDSCTGTLLTPGGQCTVTMLFTPSAAGQRAGELAVTTEDDGEPPVSVTVPATVDVPAPQLAVSPGVATYGDAVQVTGTAFPPGRSITLTWSTGLGSARAMASGSGALHAAMVIFPDDATGPRTLLATSAAVVLATAPFLVQQAPTEPPFSSGSPS